MSAQSTHASEPVLAVEHVSRHFGGLRALDDVSFTASSGQITGLIGPNGSGKTTMFNIVSGFLRPTEGSIRLNGEDITGLPPHRMNARGLARTFQIPKPFRSLSVAQTVRLAASANPHSGAEDPDAIAVEVGLGSKRDLYPDELTAADLHALELAKALATGARFILLDEIFAGLNPAEIDRVVALIRRVAAAGRSFLLIEHRMRAVMALCDRLHVLLYGRLAISGMPAEVVRDPKVIEAYLGAGPAKHA